MVAVVLFYVHLVYVIVICYRYFMVIWYMYFMVIWCIKGHLVYFSRFGVLYKKKSGNPALDSSSSLISAF
jgi:hypothetical protein